MRKLFYLLSLLIVASMLLAACGGAAPAEEPAAPAPAEPEAPAPAAEEPAAPAAEEPAMGAMKSKDPATYTKVVFGEPETLDPVLSYETAGGEIVINVYETLVWYDGDKTDVFVPVLAESWDVSADGTVYTFKIRSGVTFHNGNDMTPSDVAYTFQRGLLYGGYSGPQWLLAEPFFGIGTDDVSLLVDPEGNLADDGEALKGADPALLKAACEKVTSAIVADDAAGTVTMTLAQPWGPFIPTMAGTWGSVMDKEWTMENGGWDGSCDTWQNYYAIPSEENPLSEIMNGTGPFMLERWTKGQELVLVRNDNYWREPAKLERIVTQSISEWSTRFAMLQAGDADEVAVPVENRPQVDALVYETCTFNLDTGEYECEVTNPDGFMRVYLGRPGTSRTDIFLNFDIDPNSNYIGSGQLDGNGIPVDFFSDVHVRRAFAYCFDWDIYINDIFNGEAVQSPVLPMYGMPGYDANQEVYTYDPAKCEENFKLADVDKDGIPAGEDPDDVWEVGFRIQALYNQGNTTRQTIGEILGANLADVNSKFVIETVGVPWPSFLRTFRGGLGPIMSSGWVEDIHDPHNWYVPYMVGTYAFRQNLPDDLRSQFQDAINAGVAETDPAARQAIYEPLNQLYFEQVPTILLAVGTSHAFEQAYVKGVVLNPALFGNYYYPVYKD